MIRVLFLMAVSIGTIPQEGLAAPEAAALVRLAQEQLSVNSESVHGEMKIYKGPHLHRTYSFMMGRQWKPDTRAEFLRVEFETSTDDSSMHSNYRYLLKRERRDPPSQWLYLPALRRVRIVPYQPGDRLLQSDLLFYDMTSINAYDDYHYRFVKDDLSAPVIEGTPLGGGFVVPYEKLELHLERRGNTYLITEITSANNRGEKKQLQFLQFVEIAPERYRPQLLVVKSADDRTEVVFREWSFQALDAMLFMPMQLETRVLRP